uniref:Uncharacterized protein n=1 Tax=Arundo donax TaxID=35708 RepID=A0A0A9F104_ARUDO
MHIYCTCSRSEGQRLLHLSGQQRPAPLRNSSMDELSVAMYSALQGACLTKPRAPRSCRCPPPPRPTCWSATCSAAGCLSSSPPGAARRRCRPRSLSGTPPPRRTSGRTG